MGFNTHRVFCAATVLITRTSDQHLVTWTKDLFLVQTWTSYGKTPLKDLANYPSSILAHLCQEPRDANLQAHIILLWWVQDPDREVRCGRRYTSGLYCWCFMQSWGSWIRKDQCCLNWWCHAETIAWRFIKITFQATLLCLYASINCKLSFHLI